MEEEEDMSELLDALVWGHRMVNIQAKDGEEQTFVLHPLALEERNIGNYIYKQAVKRNTAAGVLTREQRIKEAIDNKLWKATYDDDLLRFRKELIIQVSALQREEADKMLDSRGKPKRKSPTSLFKKLQNRVQQLTVTIQQPFSSVMKQS